MFKKRQILNMILFTIFFGSYGFSDVPSPTVHKVSIPFFMQPMRFQTVGMNIFTPEISGMIPDQFSDLQWNPAYILRTSNKTVYLDFNSQFGSTSTLVRYSEIPVSYYSTDQYYYSDTGIYPGWYSQSTINTIDATPHYNLGLFFPIGRRLSIGLINRSLFDYAPFRSTIYWDNWGGEAADKSANYIPDDLIPQRLEVDDNQQTVIGTQTELYVGMRLSEKIDCGLRLGHYVFNRNGELYDSKWGTYPHYSFGNLDDESLEIDGNHIEVGLGLNVHLNPKTQLGLSGGFMQGEGTEAIASLDTSDSWSERDTDPDYYNISYSYLQSKESYESDGDRTYFTLNFEKQLSLKLIFRSFFQIRQKKIDIEGMKASSDTTYSDRTYDYYYNSNDHFRRRESHSSRENGLNGTGQEKTTHWKWFGSVVYTPGETWSLFGGLQIQRASMSREFGEFSDYWSHSWTEYSIYKPETQEYNYSEEKIYEYTDHSLQWSAWIPIGMQIEVAKGLRLILGSDVSLRLTDEDSDGALLYPYIINKKREDGRVVVDDEEINRYEEFHSDPAKEFNRQIGNRFGLTYQHPIGLQLFISSYGDLFDVNNWAFGLQMNW